MLAAAAISAATAATDSPQAVGASITPTTTDDRFGEGPNQCTLREAVQAANTDTAFGGCPAGSGPDVIKLPDGNFLLTRPGDEDANAQGDLDTAGALSIVHSGIGPATVNGGGLDRVFDTQGGGSSLTLSGLTVSGGVGATGSGGGIRNLLGTLTLTNVTVSNNVSSASGNGGGIQSNGTAFLTNVTISGNSTANSGGGLRNNGNAFLKNVTVAGNTADGDGAGGGAGGGVSAAGVATIVGSTIVASNGLGFGSPPGSAAPDCDGTLGTAGNNLIGSTANCGFNPLAAPGFVDLVNQDPQLRPLADNGGPTFTQATDPTSPAIGQGGSGAGNCADSDQRGVPRPLGACDIGAYELVKCRGVVVNRIGTSRSDGVNGTGGSDGFLLFGGDDLATGFGGDDAFCADAGRDIVDGGGGDDILKGGRGRDGLSGGNGVDLVFGGTGNDRWLRGGGGRDILKGGAGSDDLSGGPGRDRLFGNRGDDDLFGSTGEDNLKGQAGRDSCKGGAGKDRFSSCEHVTRVP